MVTAQADASGVNPTPEPYGRSRGHARTLPGFGLAALGEGEAGTGGGGRKQATSFRHVDPASIQGAF